MPRKKGATYADIQALPEHLVGEIIGGSLIVSPRPRPAHSEVQFALGVGIGGFNRGGTPGGWRFMTEPELRLGDDIIVPDLAGWRLERMPALPTTAYVSLAPDWVCEILSPSTRGHDRAEKVPLYARQGVRHAWIVEPDQRTIEVFRLEGGHFALVQTVGVEGPSRVRLEPFDAIEIETAHWWPPAT